MNENDDARIAHERLVSAALEVTRIALAGAPELRAELAGGVFGGLVSIAFGGDHASVIVQVGRPNGEVVKLVESDMSLKLAEQRATIQ